MKMKCDKSKNKSWKECCKNCNELECLCTKYGEGERLYRTIGISLF